MIDTSTVIAFGYAFLVLAGLVAVGGVAAIVAAVRDLRSTPTPYVITFDADVDLPHAA